MTNKERKPSGLLHSADELKQLIAENPDLPIVVFAGDDTNTGDYTYCRETKDCRVRCILETMYHLVCRPCGPLKREICVFQNTLTKHCGKEQMRPSDFCNMMMLFPNLSNSTILMSTLKIPVRGRYA